MTEYRRYAVYYAPPAGSELAAFGAAWLGWDAAAGVEVTHPAAPVDVARLTATPRKYGFHGTLKPPFILTNGQKAHVLSQAIAELATRHAAFEIPISLAHLGRFCGLVPDGGSPALAALAGACVTGLDRFRAPATNAELAKRRANGLTERQDANLTRWGYPYVLEEFRFHLTLTGALSPEEAPAVEAALAELTAPLTARAMPVREICLFGEAADGRFRILERHALTG